VKENDVALRWPKNVLASQRGSSCSSTNDKL